MLEGSKGKNGSNELGGFNSVSMIELGEGKGEEIEPIINVGVSSINLENFNNTNVI